MPNQSQATDQSEAVRIVGATPMGLALWHPASGPETQHLLANLNLPDPSRNRIRAEGLSILAKCAPPLESPRSLTGIIIGYVQSGKTMSFTTVAALARDNGYQIVIVIAGISKHLFEQSRRRLDNDLRIQDRRDRKWEHFPNPTPDRNTIQNIDGTLQSWRDKNVPPFLRPTVLITVMKNRKRLDDLIGVLSGLSLEGVPTLVIDDEADQAGLNTLIRQNDSSATYQRLLEIRRLLPHHSFLQYTATPQAPLLINLIDILSPTFADVLTPGPDYAGGREFFLERRELIRIIPPHEIPTSAAPLTEPPESLLEAMRLFFLGATAGYQLDQGEGNRSMMVHPSEKILQHAEYFNWVLAIKEEWRRLLELPSTDPDRQHLVEDFRGSYSDLKQTVHDLPQFDELLLLLLHAIRKTHVTQVNSVGAKTKVDWKATYPHILVGGQAMDRGFTVEGLTVTYMPRGIGTGQADTIQQRARFFGYKRPYLSYCRVFLEQRVKDAYLKYIEHEEDVRQRLLRHRDSGKPLHEWRRAFFLNTDLRPTRQCVIGLDYMQDRFSDAWFTPVSPQFSQSALSSNRRIAVDFLKQLSLRPDQGHPSRTPIQSHLLDKNASLRLAFDELLTKLSFSHPKDSQHLTGLLLQIEEHLQQHPDAKCAVYQISSGERRRREVDEEGEILNLFQGEHPVEQQRRGEIYPGDRRIKADQGLTIQIHTLTLSKKQTTVAENVCTVAVWVPAEMAAGWVVQNQGGRGQT